MKLQIGGATLENVAVEEAVALLRGLSNPEIKIKRKYTKKKQHHGGWESQWTDEEKKLMEDKIRNNFSCSEIVARKFFPNRTDNGVRFYFYKTRKGLLRKRVNPVAFTSATNNYPTNYLPN